MRLRSAPAVGKQYLPSSWATFRSAGQATVSTGTAATLRETHTSSRTLGPGQRPTANLSASPAPSGMRRFWPKIARYRRSKQGQARRATTAETAATGERSTHTRLRRSPIGRQWSALCKRSLTKESQADEAGGGSAKPTQSRSEEH